MGYIYKVTNLTNGKIYIGQTARNVDRRWREHIWDAHGRCSCNGLHNAIRKYSEHNFDIETVEQCDNVMLNEREKYWIGFYHSNNKHIGYNLTDGGDSNYQKNPDSEETKYKKSAAQAGINNSFYGKHHSANHRANISTPVVAYTDDLAVHMYYVSQIATRKYGYQQSHITDCVNGKCRHHGKTPGGKRLCWRFATVDESAVIKSFYLQSGVESLTPAMYQEFIDRGAW